MTSSSEIELSVVATIYRAEKTIPVLVEEIEKYILPITTKYEIILVEDCGPDTSWAVIQEIAQKNKHVKGIKLSRNYGQQIAMSAGVHVASGEYVIIMDGDLQNPPSAFPELWNKVKEGYDIVYAVSSKRNNVKDQITSRLFWFMIKKVFKVKIVQDQLMLRIMNRNFVEVFKKYFEANRTITGITESIGMKEATIPVTNQKRHEGTSNYSFYKRFNLMIDVVLNLTNAPLNVIINFSLITLFFTILFSAYRLYLYFFCDVAPGFTSIIISIFLFGSLTLLVLGIIGRYLSNIYTEVRRRPLFLIQEKVNLTITDNK